MEKTDIISIVLLIIVISIDLIFKAEKLTLLIACISFFVMIILVITNCLYEKKRKKELFKDIIFILLLLIGFLSMFFKMI